MHKRVMVVILFVLLFIGFLEAQTTPSLANCSNRLNLGCLIPNVYGPNGLTLPNESHSAHFENDFQANFSPLNAAIASELTLLPLASPAAGFTYTFDHSSGTYSRTAKSFGPILAERSETIGKGKVFVGVTYQYFSFDSLDGIDLNDMPAVFKHELHTGPEGSDPPYEKDFITTANSINLFVNQMTAFATVGLSNRLDVSIAVPVLNVNMSVNSAATIHRTAPGPLHYFDPADTLNSLNKDFSDRGHATGIGDVTLRFKGTVVSGQHASLALATDLRLPTGDEQNFLGSGTLGIRPFLIASVSAGRVAPHVNVGYEINGNSILAGDVLSGRKGHLANHLFYTVGTDIGVSKRFTLAFDFLGQRIFDAASVFNDTPYVSSVPEIPNSNVTIQDSYRQIGIQTRSFNILSGSAGFKVQLVDKLLLTTNLLFQMNNEGLRAKVVPLVGLSYSF